MICKFCREAADLNTYNKPMLVMVKIERHKPCRGGTWCDCQHKVKVVSK